MTRPTSNKPAMSSSQHNNIPPRLQLSNGAASSSRDSQPSLVQSSEESRTLSSTHTGGKSGRDSQRKERGGGGGRGERDRGRERSSRLVLNGELVESQLSPKTQESIFQVFSFDTKATEFEESVSQVWPHRCSYVVKELIETERAYVEALGDIIKVLYSSTLLWGIYSG